MECTPPLLFLLACHPTVFKFPGKQNRKLTNNHIWPQREREKKERHKEKGLYCSFIQFMVPQIVFQCPTLFWSLWPSRCAQHSRTIQLQHSTVGWGKRKKQMALVSVFVVVAIVNLTRISQRSNLGENIVCFCLQFAGLQLKSGWFS